jgi:hypothetical protein
MRSLIAVVGVLACGAALVGQVSNTVARPVEQQQYDLSNEGRAFLVQEAANSSLFMLGELHGEDEIPSLIRVIWPSMWEAGYRHVAAEISPWWADRLEFGTRNSSSIGLWTRPEATFVASLKGKGAAAVIWGCDIEEIQPQLVLRDLAAANPADEHLRAAVALAGNVYQRRTAPMLLQHVQSATTIKDLVVNDISLRRSLIQTLEVERDRSNGAALTASVRREGVMKDLFHEHWLKAGKPRVFLRFGRNHLHRGYDRRGVSTLGNFVAELGVAEHLKVFNVAAFAGGGKIALSGTQSDADERGEDPALAYLASIARYRATVFDLRPMRQPLHRLPDSKRSAVEASLTYWADSYDAIIFYRAVTPLIR